MVYSGYHPLKHRSLRIVLGWCTVDIIPLKHRPLWIVLGWCTVDSPLKLGWDVQWISSS